jgi:hypothetical protein
MAEMHRGRPWLLRASLLALGAGLTTGTVTSSGVLASDAVPTFSADVAPLVHAKCGVCHHPGGAGPFALLDYDDVVEHARDMRSSPATVTCRPGDRRPASLRTSTTGA